MYFWFGTLLGFALMGILVGVIMIWSDRPKRNCDVGTAEEQVLRHHKEFCRAHSGDEVCCAQYNCEYCFSRWAQAPYGDSPPMITIDSYTKGE